MIKSVEEDDKIILETNELKSHITEYYKGPFGSEADATIYLVDDLWEDSLRVLEEDKVFVTRPFAFAELEQAVKDMKNNTVPGPNGFSTLFFKEFWGHLEMILLEMLNSLHRGELDLARLNYGIIMLIPKVNGPTNIKQFRPICLLNVIYKIITKVLTIKLTMIAGKVVGLSQTAFIPNGNILDGGGNAP